ncbi:MAG: O-antigen ligase family protein [Oscillospiraceae bacterium]
MVSNSILGRMYGAWLGSAVFSFLYALFRPFKRAFHTSAFIGFFKRESTIERAYRASVFSKLLRAIIEALLFIPKKLFEKSAPAASGSALLRVASGSFILNFEFLLGAFILVMFVAPHDYWSNTYALLASGGLFVIYGLMAASGKRKVFYPESLGFPFLLFVFACLLSLLFTRSLSDSIRVLLFFITAFLLTFVIAADITDEQRLMKLMGFIYVAVMLTALYALFQRITGVKVDMLLTDLSTNKGVPGRVYSTLDNPNNYAEFLVLFTPLCAAFAMNVKNKLLRLPLSLALALPMLAMVMTYSRSGWISILLAAIVFVCFAERKLVPLFFLACVLALPFMPDSVMVRIASIFNKGDTSAAHRFYVWHGITLLLEDKGQWFTGIGLGPETFNQIYPIYARKWATEGVFHSQMLYLELFLELGTLGFVSFFWLMLRSVKDGARALYHSENPKVKAALIACCASFIGLIPTAAVEYIWYYPRVLFAFFILLGICMAATRITFHDMELDNER